MREDVGCSTTESKLWGRSPSRRQGRCRSAPDNSVGIEENDANSAEWKVSSFLIYKHNRDLKYIYR